MLLSNQFQFLYVHIAKTGGTSVRSALSRLKWTDPYAFPSWICHRISHLTGHRIGVKLPRHAGVVAAASILPSAIYRSLWKFTFVRNPWDRLVSAYCHYQREYPSVLEHHQIKDFDQFVSWILWSEEIDVGPKPELYLAVRQPQWQHVIDLNGRNQMNFVGCCENLAEDFIDVCNHLQIVPPKLPTHRRSYRPRDYRPNFTDETAAWVAEFYRSDVDHFGYRFDDWSSPAQGANIGHLKTGTSADNDAFAETGCTRPRVNSKAA